MDETEALSKLSALAQGDRRPSPQDMVAHSKCLCGKMLPVVDWVRPWHSGVINYTELLCQDCRVTYKELSRIVCVGCRSLMGFVEPGRDPKTGFVFKSKHHYHIMECPRCNPKVTSTTIVEHGNHCKEQNIEIRENKDLVQEIEQKRLQGEREAEKMRAEFESTSD